MGRRLPPGEDKTMRMGHVRHVREEDGRRRPRLRLRVFRWILLAVFLLSALILLLVWVLARFSRTQPPSLTGYVNESIRAFVQSVPAATRFPEHDILLVTADGSRREITLAGENTRSSVKLSPEGGYALVMMTSASGDRILVRVDLDSGEADFVTMTEAYTHYAWLDEGTFLLFPSLLSEENPLQAIDSRTMQPKELLTLAPEQFHDGGIERIELGALCWDSLGRRYLLVANVYDAETHSATLVVTSYQQDGSFRERLIEKRDMQMPSAGGRVEPQIAVIRSGAIAVSAIERVQGTPYNRVLLYDGYGRLDRAAAGVSLQASGLPAAFYDQNVFAAVSDPVEGGSAGRRQSGLADAGEAGRFGADGCRELGRPFGPGLWGGFDRWGAVFAGGLYRADAGRRGAHPYDLPLSDGRAGFGRAGGGAPCRRPIRRGDPGGRDGDSHRRGAAEPAQSGRASADRDRGA